MESISPEAAAGATGPGRFAPAGRTYRFVLLFFVSLLTFGSYFAYDSIGALAPTLIEELHLDRETIGSLYSAYSLAAIFIVFFGGMLIDRLGPRRASLLFSILVTAGAVIVGGRRQHLDALPRPLRLRRRLGVAGRRAERDHRALVQGQGAGARLRHRLTLSRLGTLFSFNTEQLIASLLRRLPLRALGGGAAVRLLAAVQPGLQRAWT